MPAPLTGGSPAPPAARLRYGRGEGGGRDRGRRRRHGHGAARSSPPVAADTVLLERFAFGHANGSSGGPTRIFRLTYHDPEYVRMARHALRSWQELEAGPASR